MTGEQHHLGVGQRRPHRADQVGTLEVGQHEVGDQQVGFFLLTIGDPLARRTELGHHLEFLHLPQRQPDQLAEQGLVLDQNDALLLHAAGSGANPRGPWGPEGRTAILRISRRLEAKPVQTHLAKSEGRR